MKTGTLVNRLLDVVVRTPLDDADDDFVAVAFTILSLAISRLPPDEREAMLQGIEDYGALRRAVAMFPTARLPITGNGHGHHN